MSDPDRESIERRAEQAGQHILRSLPTQDEVRREVQQVVGMLAVRQERLAEWMTLHHLLHDLLTYFAPFHSLLLPLADDGEGYDAFTHQALLQSWRPFQRGVDQLLDFAEGIEHIGRPLGRDGELLRGEGWVVEIVSLQLQLENALKEDDPRAEEVFELAMAVQSVCHRGLSLTDFELRAAADEVLSLSKSLMGGLV